MKKLYFKVKFISPVVLYATSNNQGKMVSLDYIPGSNFLGMVARNYAKFSNPFDIFHSSKVRFGDASPFVCGERFFKIPLSFFYEKLDNKEIYNHLLLSDDDFKKLDDLNKQLKQIRSGFMSENFKKYNLTYEYSQKSAYDSDKRTSKESAMYGYNALKAGSEWIFSVKIDDEISQSDTELIKTTLLESKMLGKSKTAQYGQISIEEINFKDEVKQKAPNDGLTYIYVNSKLALVDKNGAPSYDLKHLCKDELKQEQICFDKNQVKFSSFTPFNSTRAGRDDERFCIEKGSVIVLKNLKQEKICELENGVGAFLSEGFGEVLVNPEFLNCNDIKFIDFEQTPSKNCEISSHLAKFLKAKQEKWQSDLDTIMAVDDFISKHKLKFKEVTNSQWGQIRNICLLGDEIYAKIEHYITHGVAAPKWENAKNELLAAIKENGRDFGILLAMKMPQILDKGGKND